MYVYCTCILLNQPFPLKEYQNYGHYVELKSKPLLFFWVFLQLESLLVFIAYYLMILNNVVFINLETLQISFLNELYVHVHVYSTVLIEYSLLLHVHVYLQGRIHLLHHPTVLLELCVQVWVWLLVILEKCMES